jgi:hypothetical protein
LLLFSLTPDTSSALPATLTAAVREDHGAVNNPVDVPQQVGVLRVSVVCRKMGMVIVLSGNPRRAHVCASAGTVCKNRRSGIQLSG